MSIWTHQERSFTDLSKKFNFLTTWFPWNMFNCFRDDERGVYIDKKNWQLFLRNRLSFNWCVLSLICVHLSLVFWFMSESMNMCLICYQVRSVKRQHRWYTFVWIFSHLVGERETTLITLVLSFFSKQITPFLLLYTLVYW